MSLTINYRQADRISFDITKAIGGADTYGPDRKAVKHWKEEHARLLDEQQKNSPRRAAEIEQNARDTFAKDPTPANAEKVRPRAEIYENLERKMRLFKEADYALRNSSVDLAVRCLQRTRDALANGLAICEEAEQELAAQFGAKHVPSALANSIRDKISELDDFMSGAKKGTSHLTVETVEQLCGPID